MEKTKEEIIDQRYPMPESRLQEPLQYNDSDVNEAERSAFRAGYEMLEDLVDSLKAENFKLAAMACFHPTGDDYGNRTCNDSSVCMAVEVVASLKAERERLREALREIEAVCDNENDTHERIWRVVNEALNPSKD